MTRSLPRVALLLGLLLPYSPARGEDPSVLGAWRLTAYVREEVESGVVARPWGERPQGYLMLLPGGQMSMVISAEGRVAAPHDGPAATEQAAKLLSTMTAYAGTYTLSGDRIVFHVQVAWRPDWVGTDQARQLKVEGNRLVLRSTPMKSATTGKSSVYILTWERAG